MSRILKHSLLFTSSVLAIAALLACPVAVQAQYQSGGCAGCQADGPHGFGCQGSGCDSCDSGCGDGCGRGLLKGRGLLDGNFWKSLTGGGRGCQECDGCGTCGPYKVPTLQDVVCNGASNCQQRCYGQPDLFYNYYADPTCGQNSANLYIAPRPVPQMVGHTYYTYQPFMPHEWMYPHYRTYHRYYDGGRGLTRTKAVWYTSPITSIGDGIRNLFYIPR